MKKVMVITGSRADYGILKPIMKAINKSPTLELYTVVTGMHLSCQFGYTINEIEKDGFIVTAKIDMLLDGNSGTTIAKSIGVGIISFAQMFDIFCPDIILILGDRMEALAAATAAAYMNIPIAHIHGGDCSEAGLDEYARHAITKLSHIHFVATDESAKRVLKLGENPKFVYVVGAPGLDTIFQENFISKQELLKSYGLDSNKQLLLVIQHPVTTEIDEASIQMLATLLAILDLEFQTIIIYPNADAGGKSMIDIIRKYENIPFIRTFKNLPHKEYLNLMNVADVMIGNSSSGIIEAPSFGLPVVNIGIRQYGRQRAENIIDVEHNKEEIKLAIEKSLNDRDFRKRIKSCKNPYGDGRASEKIIKILNEIDINDELLKKHITY